MGKAGMQFLLVIVCISLCYFVMLLFFICMIMSFYSVERKAKERISTLLKANMEKHHYENIEVINERASKIYA